MAGRLHVVGAHLATQPLLLGETLELVPEPVPLLVSTGAFRLGSPPERFGPGERRAKLGLSFRERGAINPVPLLVRDGGPLDLPSSHSPSASGDPVFGSYRSGSVEQSALGAPAPLPPELRSELHRATLVRARELD
eukprot:10543057-Alexandrium_andersonii.AAC.1